MIFRISGGQRQAGKDCSIENAPFEIELIISYFSVSTSTIFQGLGIKLLLKDPSVIIGPHKDMFIDFEPFSNASLTTSSMLSITSVFITTLVSISICSHLLTSRRPSLTFSNPSKPVTSRYCCLFAAFKDMLRLEISDFSTLFLNFSNPNSQPLVTTELLISSDLR